MTMQQQIEVKLQKELTVTHLEVINESGGHNVPAGSESHFKVIIVSEQFNGQSPINRHRLINKILADELKNHIHALSLVTKTPEEWQRSAGQHADTPPCRGGLHREEQ